MYVFHSLKEKDFPNMKEALDLDQNRELQGHTDLIEKIELPTLKKSKNLIDIKVEIPGKIQKEIKMYSKP